MSSNIAQRPRSFSKSDDQSLCLEFKKTLGISLRIKKMPDLHMELLINWLAIEPVLDGYCAFTMVLLSNDKQGLAIRL